MRILVATHNFPRFEGDPAGAFVARLAVAARDAGHNVLVVAPHAPGTARLERHGALEIRRFRYAPDALERVGYRGDLHRARMASLLALLGVPVFLLAFRAALARAVHDFAPDVIHAHWWLPAGWLATRHRRPLVVTCHGSDVRMLDHSRVARALAARVFARAAAVTTVSEFLARDLRERFPSLAPKLHVLSMPLDVDHFAAGARAPKAQPPRILYAGNLLASKGVADLLDAYARLRQRGVACQLKLLGEGPARGELRSRAQSLGLLDEIVWSDFVPQTQMPDEYGASTVSVLPTRGQAEGLGLALAESLLAGCAVVGTPAGGIPEVVRHEETGLVARDGDPGDLAAQLERLLTDDDLRERLTTRGAELARERFATDRAAARFLTLYDAVTRGRGAR